METWAYVGKDDVGFYVRIRPWSDHRKDTWITLR